MTDHNNQTTIADIARASYDAARNAALPAGSQNSRANLRAVSVGVVDTLAEAAEMAARRVLPRASEQAALTVWGEILDRLADHWLTDAVICGRSGRRLYTLAPDPWLDYLSVVASLGDDDPLRAAAVDRIFAAVVNIKARTTSPVVLDINSPGLALARLADPRDYCLISLAAFFPRPSVSTMHTAIELAQRAEVLNSARLAMAELPAPVLAYAAECLSLYCSNIDPSKLPNERHPLTYYKGDLVAPWRSTATVGHLCGRLVQGLIAEIAALRLRPLDRLTKADLRRLRVHYNGVPGQAHLRADMAELRLAQKLHIQRTKREQSRLAISPQARDNIQSLRQDADLAALLDALDLQTAISATGRNVALDLETKDAPTALSRRDHARAVRAAHADNMLGGELGDDFDDLFDLADILASGQLPEEFLPELDDEAELFTDADLDALEINLFAEPDEQETDPDELSAHDLLGALDLDQFMTEANAPARAPRRQPYRPSAESRKADDASAAALSEALAVFDTVSAEPAKPAQAAVLRRRIIGQINKADSGAPEPVSQVALADAPKIEAIRPGLTMIKRPKR